MYIKCIICTTDIGKPHSAHEVKDTHDRKVGRGWLTSRVIALVTHIIVHLKSAQYTVQNSEHNCTQNGAHNVVQNIAQNCSYKCTW